jgi:hypothetical protein
MIYSSTTYVWTIRSEQLKALERERLQRFKDRLRRRLETWAPGGQDFRAQIDRALAEGPSFGLISEKDIARFAEITCCHLGGFPEGRLPRPALAILMAHGVTSGAKLERYLAWATRDDRDLLDEGGSRRV